MNKTLKICHFREIIETSWSRSVSAVVIDENGKFLDLKIGKRLGQQDLREGDTVICEASFSLNKECPKMLIGIKNVSIERGENWETARSVFNSGINEWLINDWTPKAAK